MTALLLGLALSGVRSVPAQPYRWKSVQIVGGGFVDGIVFHPHQRGLRYARTDIGGAYRWDDGRRQWIPLLDWLGLEDVNLMGVESIALDPCDPNRLYLACGMYTNASSPNAAILRSTDRGRTFQRADLPFKMGGNENGRGNGERLAVDPSSNNVLFFGSRNAGLWRSSDFAKSWSQVTGFPSVPSAGVGIVSVLFDPHGDRPSGHAPSRTVYAAVSASSQTNLFRSRDAGVTWMDIPGEPIQYRPTRMVLVSDGNLFITYGSSAGPSRMRDGAVWRLDTRTDRWTDITPDKPDPTNRPFGYAAVSVQTDDPKVLVVSSFYRPGGEEIFRSTDSGATWKPVFHQGGGAYDYSLAPYVSKTPIHWLFDLEIDPNSRDHAIFTTGYGGYETFDLSDVDRGRPTKWQVMSKGIEETVALELVSPSLGEAHLVTGIGDYGGFVHWNLDKPSPEGTCDNPRFGNTTGIACAPLDPKVMVRVGRAAGQSTGGNIGYSLDGGRTWQPPPSTPQPSSGSGRVAISANGKTWIWTPQRSVPYRTDDQGRSWRACSGLAANTRLIADPIDPLKFYGVDLFGGTLFESDDGGRSFSSSALELPGGLPKPGGDRFDNRGGQDKIYATPGREGDLWLAAFDGLYHSPRRGSWTRIDGVERIQAFGFGKAAPSSGDPAIYLCGVVKGVRAIFRSDDFGSDWTRINDDRHQWGLVLQIAGDPRLYGRVYVGTHGRGVLYGDPR